MATFNLTTEPWIPVLTLTGAQEQLSIRELFARADQLSAIAAELPTVSIALQRLLQAILLRVVTPLPPAIEDRVDIWGELWREGLPQESINQYLNRWSRSFDLFDESVPFFQVPGVALASGKGSGLVKLMADVPAGTKHFITRAGSGIEKLTYAEAARWLVHAQAFDCAGIKSGVVGDDRVKGGKSYSFGYPAFSGTLGIVSLEGNTLAQTLLLNLHLGATEDDDVPPWESAPQRIAGDAVYPTPRGAAQVWTWPSRMIRLIPEAGFVVDAVLSNGERLAPQNLFRQEPMAAWRYSRPQSTKEKRDIQMPVTHNAGQAAWRGLAGLLGLSPTGETGLPAKPAGVLDWLARTQDGGHVKDSMPVGLRCVAMVYGAQASTFGEDFNDLLPGTVIALSNQKLRQVAVDAAKDASRAVLALRDFGRHVALASGDSGDQVADRNRYLEEEAYGRLMPVFESWLASLSKGTDRLEAQTGWQVSLSRLLREVAADHARLAPSSAIFGRTIRLRDRELHMDLGRADLWFRSSLVKSLPLAHPPQNKEEDDDTATATH